MRASRLCSVAFLAAMLAACSGSDIGDRIARRTITPGGSTSTASVPTFVATTESALSLGAAPRDIRSVDWEEATLPGAFCGVAVLVDFVGGEATAQSSIWGQVHLGAYAKATFGDLDGDGHLEAAVSVSCDNGGGTASGQLAFGYVVVESVGGKLRMLGSITPQTQRADASHVPLLDSVKFERGKLVVTELWYRPSDATCCPSGKARTTWELRDGTLSPKAPVLS